MAKRRDFGSEIQELSLRRQQLLSQVNIPNDVMIKVQAKLAERIDSIDDASSSSSSFLIPNSSAAAVISSSSSSSSSSKELLVSSVGEAEVAAAEVEAASSQSMVGSVAGGGGKRKKRIQRQNNHNNSDNNNHYDNDDNTSEEEDDIAKESMGNSNERNVPRHEEEMKSLDKGSVAVTNGLHRVKIEDDDDENGYDDEESLSTMISQLNVNRLSRIFREDCLESLDIILSEQHIYLRPKQLMKLLPAHIEILIEVAKRAYTENIDEVLNRVCRLMECLFTSSVINSQTGKELTRPIMSTTALNAMIAVALDTPYYNETLNVIEMIIKKTNAPRNHILRACGTVFSRVTEKSTPVDPATAMRIVSAIVNTAVVLLEKEDKLDAATFSSILTTLTCVLRKTIICRSPHLFSLWSRSTHFSNLMELCNRCCEFKSLIPMVFQSLSNLCYLHVSFAADIAIWRHKPSSRDLSGVMLSGGHLHTAMNVIFPSGFLEMVWDPENYSSSHCLDFLFPDIQGDGRSINTACSVIRFFITLARNLSIARNLLVGAITPRHCLTLCKVIGEELLRISRSNSKLHSQKSDHDADRDATRDRSFNNEKITNGFSVQISITLEAVVELFLILNAPFGSTIPRDTSYCFCNQHQHQGEHRHQGDRDGSTSSCASCVTIRDCNAFVEYICSNIYDILTSGTLDAVATDVLCRVVQRLSRHYNLSQSRVIVSQLSRIMFNSPEQFDLQKCGVVSVLSAFAGFTELSNNDGISCYSSQSSENESPAGSRKVDIVFYPGDEMSSHGPLCSLLEKQLLQSSFKDQLQCLVKTMSSLVDNAVSEYSKLEHFVPKASRGQINVIPSIERENYKSVAGAEKLHDLKQGVDTESMLGCESDTSTTSSDDKPMNDEVVVSTVPVRVVKSTIASGNAQVLKVPQESSLQTLIPCISALSSTVVPFKEHFHTSLLVHREYIAGFLGSWTTMSSREVYSHVMIMHGLVRSSGIGSLLYIIPEIDELAMVFAALITGSSAKLPSSVTVSESTAASGLNTESKPVRHVTQRPLPKLVPHNHTPALRSHRCLTICTVRLLADIVAHSPSALGDYKPIITFLCSNLEAAVIGRSTHMIPDTDKDPITHGISHYGSLVGTIDRVDDDFILSCIDLLTLFLRSHRSTHNESVISREKKKSAAANSLSIHQRSQIYSRKEKMGVDSAVMKAHLQSNVLREVVSSKLMVLGDCLWMLGEALCLRPILRLLVEISPVLGNVVTNTASGSISSLSEPRSVVLTRFVVLGLRAHCRLAPKALNTGRSRQRMENVTNIHHLAAGLDTGLLACIIINSIAIYNPKAVFDALSRAEVDYALADLFNALLSNSKEKFRQGKPYVGSEDEERESIAQPAYVPNEAVLIRQLRIIVRTLRWCLQLGNPKPYVSYDPMWSYSIYRAIADDTALFNCRLHHIPQRINCSLIASSKTWNICDILVKMISRFSSAALTTVPVECSGSEMTTNLLSIVSCFEAIATSCQAAAGIAESLSNACLVDEINRKHFDSVLTVGTLLCRIATWKLNSDASVPVYNILNNFGPVIANVIGFTFAIRIEPSVANKSTKGQSKTVAAKVTPLPNAKSIPTDSSELAGLEAVISPPLLLLNSLLRVAFDLVIERLTDFNGDDSITSGAAGYDSVGSLVLAVFRASYICPESVPIHNQCLSILAEIARNNCSIFGKKKKIASLGTLSSEPDSMLERYSGFQIKPKPLATTDGKVGVGLSAMLSTKKSRSTLHCVQDSSRAGADSLTVITKETHAIDLSSNSKPKRTSSDSMDAGESIASLGTITQCANFLVTAVTLCPHDPVFMRNFASVFMLLVSIGDSSRLAIVNSGLHKMLFILLRGVRKSLVDLYPHLDELMSVEKLVTAGYTRADEKLDLLSYISLEHVVLAVVDLCQALNSMVKNEEHAMVLYGCSILDCLLEILTSTCTLLTKFTSASSIRPLEESVLLGYVHVEVLFTCLAFANTSQIRTQLFSSAAAKLVEDSAGIVLTVGDYFSKPFLANDMDSADTSAANLEKINKNRADFGSWMHSKYYDCDSQIDAFLKLHLSVGNCVVS